MMFASLVFFALAHLSIVSLSQPIVPTYWGTNDCDAVPVFSLQDVNPYRTDTYQTSYGMDDFKPYTYDVLIVGLYFADNADSWANVRKQDDLGKALEDKGYKVKNAVLNYFAPLSCVLEGECVNFWWNSPYLFPSYDNCVGYVAGCAPDDERLIASKWQDLLADNTDMPIFQDTASGWIWDEFGGLQGDIYLYDADGRLVSYLCNIENEGAACDTPLTGGGLIDDDSYAVAKKAAIAAAELGTGRCKDTAVVEDDVYYSGEQAIYYVDDYYYYNGFGTTDESSVGKAMTITRRHTTHKIVHKIPTYVYAAIVAVIASFATCLVLYCRWKRNKSRNMLNGGIVRFTQLPTEDDDFVFENTAIGGMDPNPFSNGGNGNGALRGNDRYGSL